MNSSKDASQDNKERKHGGKTYLESLTPAKLIVLGFVAFTTISLVFILVAVYATSFSLSHQEVFERAGIVVQATLGVAAMVGVTLALIKIAMQSDRSIQKQTAIAEDLKKIEISRRQDEDRAAARGIEQETTRMMQSFADWGQAIYNMYRKPEWSIEQFFEETKDPWRLIFKACNDFNFTPTEKIQDDFGKTKRAWEEFYSEIATAHKAIQRCRSSLSTTRFKKIQGIRSGIISDWLEWTMGRITPNANLELDRLYEWYSVNPGISKGPIALLQKLKELSKLKPCDADIFHGPGPELKQYIVEYMCNSSNAVDDVDVDDVDVKDVNTAVNTVLRKFHDDIQELNKAPNTEADFRRCAAFYQLGSGFDLTNLIPLFDLPILMLDLIMPSKRDVAKYFEEFHESLYHNNLLDEFLNSLDDDTLSIYFNANQRGQISDSRFVRVAEIYGALNNPRGLSDSDKRRMLLAREGLVLILLSDRRQVEKAMFERLLQQWMALRHDKESDKIVVLSEALYSLLHDWGEKMKLFDKRDPSSEKRDKELRRECGEWVKQRAEVHEDLLNVKTRPDSP